MKSVTVTTTTPDIPVPSWKCRNGPGVHKHQVCRCDGCPGCCGCGGLDPDTDPIECGCAWLENGSKWCCPAYRPEPEPSWWRRVVARLRP